MNFQLPCAEGRIVTRYRELKDIKQIGDYGLYDEVEMQVLCGVRKIRRVEVRIRVRRGPVQPGDCHVTRWATTGGQ